MEAIKETFAKCKEQKRSALVAYLTAGFPTTEETVDNMLGMENGGAGAQLSPSLCLLPHSKHYRIFAT